MRMRLNDRGGMLVFILMPVLALLLVACSDPLTVHFIDVGMGDAILIQTPEGKNMLIDGGDCTNPDDQYWASCGVNSQAKVVDYLKANDVKHLDVVVSTHAHGDHIGGLPAVMAQFGVGRVYDSGKPHTTALYENYLGAIEEYGVPFEIPTRGDIISLGDVKLKVLHPVDDPKDWDTNNSSVVMRLEYGDVAFMFTGDVESEGESEITSYFGPNELKSQIIKMPHHGSNTSSSDEFVDWVNPDVAIISVGENNSYGLPHDEVIQAYEDRGTKIYRTDKHGTIIVTTDGDTWEVN